MEQYGICGLDIKNEHTYINPTEEDIHTHSAAVKSNHHKERQTLSKKWITQARIIKAYMSPKKIVQVETPEQHKEKRPSVGCWK